MTLFSIRIINLHYDVYIVLYRNVSYLSACKCCTCVYFSNRKKFHAIYSSIHCAYTVFLSVELMCKKCFTSIYVYIYLPFTSIYISIYLFMWCYSWKIPMEDYHDKSFHILMIFHFLPAYPTSFSPVFLSSYILPLLQLHDKSFHTTCCVMILLLHHLSIC